MGKGSKRRPKFISNEEYAQRYDQAFGVKTKQKLSKKETTLGKNKNE